MKPSEAALAGKPAPVKGPGGSSGESEELISGSEAIAHACRLADVDVITAYPIRPYDTVMQYVSQMISNGDFDCEYIVAESEQGRGILGVIDGEHTKGIETDADVAHRKEFLRMIGYKL